MGPSRVAGRAHRGRPTPVFACRAVLLNVNEPELRGLALALQTVLDDVGKGLGPFLVAMLITVLGRCALRGTPACWRAAHRPSRTKL